MVHPTSLSFSLSLYSQTTLRLVRNSASTSTIAITYSDGTRYDNARSLDWIGVAELLDFFSDTPTVIAADSIGAFQLLQNHHQRVVITVDSACPPDGTALAPGSFSMIAQNKNVAANLQAEAGDVDLGQLNGVQFEQNGNNVICGMYASVTGRLINFQIEVAIDTSFFAAVAGSEVIGFDGAVVTLNSPPHLVRAVANDPNSNANGNDIHLGSATLRVVGSGDPMWC